MLIELLCDLTDLPGYDGHGGREYDPGDADGDDREGVAQELSHLLLMLVLGLRNPVNLNTKRHYNRCEAEACLENHYFLQALKFIGRLLCDQLDGAFEEEVEEKVGCQLPQQSDEGRDKRRAKPVEPHWQDQVVHEDQEKLDDRRDENPRLRLTKHLLSIQAVLLPLDGEKDAVEDAKREGGDTKDAVGHALDPVAARVHLRGQRLFILLPFYRPVHDILNAVD